MAAEAGSSSRAQDLASGASSPPSYLAWLFALLALVVPALAGYTVYHQSRILMLGMIGDAAMEPSSIATAGSPEVPAEEASDGESPLPSETEEKVVDASPQNDAVVTPEASSLPPLDFTPLEDATERARDSATDS